MHEKSKLYRKRVLLVLVIIVGALLLVFMFYNPMRMPAPIIRFHILRHTPIGTDMEEVIMVIENNERWGSPIVNRDSGFSHPSRFVDGYDGRPTADTVGEQSIQIRHRYSISLFPDRAIRVLWGFDENGKLIEVHVESWFVL